MCLTFSRIKSWVHAAAVARKFINNWARLLVCSALGSSGVFYFRGGGSIKMPAKQLLQTLVRWVDDWRSCGDQVPSIKFEDGFFSFEYFPKHIFKIPLELLLKSVPAPPSFFSKEYNADVSGCTVLDIGANTGDSVIYWLYRGAKKVVAVEPVPAYFQVLTLNVADKPVITLNASIGASLPRVPNVSLLELVREHNPEVVKVDCEGCEYYCVEDIKKLPQLGVKTLMIEIHGFDGMSRDELFSLLEDHFKKFDAKCTIISKARHVTAVWYFKN